MAQPNARPDATNTQPDVPNIRVSERLLDLARDYPSHAVATCFVVVGGVLGLTAIVGATFRARVSPRTSSAAGINADLLIPKLDQLIDQLIAQYNKLPSVGTGVGGGFPHKPTI
eukprot:m.51256 g.51256  ORF g.51256 m.51256 type:complete len:114 (+) comp48274_c0_seq2:44-385(+)